MLNFKFLDKKIFYFLFLLIFLFSFLKQVKSIDEITELQNKIEGWKKEIQKLEEQRKIYQERIEAARKEAISLKNQISIINNQIAKTQIEIKKKEIEIEETEYLIKNLHLKIQDQRQQIEKNKKQLASLLQTLNYYDNKSFFEIILLNEKISDFFNQINNFKILQKEIRNNLNKIKLVKEGLEEREDELRKEKEKLLTLQEDLKNTKDQLVLLRNAKQKILTETRGMEWKFQSLLAAAISEQKQIEQEIANAERLIRQKLAERRELEFLEKLEEGVGPLIFSWPVPQDKITAYFHDPEYPFKKWLGEHTGIDIKADQGTNVRAAASGYVAKARDGGFGYSYVMLLHRDGFATIYGHLSKIFVNEGEIVRRGQVIGKSGGLPGTPGAGRFSTSPHLHFEVRINGVPVNPLDYLI
jgi:murein DD-endopeptidase MepM/ murein hydrolase activator NlpD